MQYGGGEKFGGGDITSSCYLLYIVIFKSPNRNGPDLVQAFPKKWWIESDCTAPNLTLQLPLNGSCCHYNSILTILDSNKCTKNLYLVKVVFHQRYRPTFLGPRNSNYYLWVPSQLQKGHERDIEVEYLTMAQTLINFLSATRSG